MTTYKKCHLGLVHVGVWPREQSYYYFECKSAGWCGVDAVEPQPIEKTAITCMFCAAGVTVDAEDKTQFTPR